MQAGHTIELGEVRRHQDHAVADRLPRDQRVIGANRRAGLLQPGAHDAGWHARRYRRTANSGDGREV